MSDSGRPIGLDSYRGNDKLLYDMADALQRLYDFQNGCPLEKYREHWETAMRDSKSCLEAYSNLYLTYQ